MGVLQSPTALEAQRQAALASAAEMRLITLRHKVHGLRDLIRSAEAVGSPAERIKDYRSILRKAERELAAAEKA